jgi:hypothetical protein
MVSIASEGLELGHLGMLTELSLVEIRHLSTESVPR